MSKKIIKDMNGNNNINRAKKDRNVEKKPGRAKMALPYRIDTDKIRDFVRINKRVFIFSAAAIIVAISAYYAYYTRIPSLEETHREDIKGVVESYDGDVHPLEILSSNRENMADFRGEPDTKGDGNTPETKFVVYKLDWFGKMRETIIFYDSQNHFSRIKLNIGNESAKDLVQKLIADFGEPFESQSPETKGGYALWMKDSVQYKLVHHGSYATIEMKLARYENTNKLAVGDAPVVIHRLLKQDVNKDETLESILLLGNRKNSLSPEYEKLYLVVWDGKTHVAKMAEEMDGGLYPQIEYSDTDKDGKDEIVISSDNNGIVRNYNAFRYDGAKLELIYNGHDEP